ncbi:unnamed protein product [Rotaria sp. Silwood2]|nr:unnamed protein product [Rotaria sp. Silwood2]
MMTSKNGRASFSASPSALLAVPYAHTNGETRNFDLTTSSQDTTIYTAADPSYILSQLKSSEWLQRYGLKAQKLTFDQILQQIGFKRVESFNAPLGKTVGAKYAGNIYHEIQHDNGDRYVLTCRPEKLGEYRSRLIRMLNLLRKRLTFITSGSRRIFGIIGEPSVCFVCDCKTTDHRILNQVQLALITLFKEQVTKIKRFNIIWVSNDNEQFQQLPIDVTTTTVDQAGTVIKSNDSNNYIIERIDLPGIQSNISRNDIFLDSNLCLLECMEAKSFAFIKYPNDSRQCYCPSVILHHLEHDSNTKVRFYDCYIEDLANNQFVIPINKQQFEHYSVLRIEKEKSLINQVIVGLNDEEKKFMLGTIKKRVGTGHRYLIEWCDTNKSKQSDEHLFGAFTQRNKHRINDYVLAIDDDDTIYKLAKVQSISNDGKNLKVQFINLNTNNDNSLPK